MLFISTHCSKALIVRSCLLRLLPAFVFPLYCASSHGGLISKLKPVPACAALARMAETNHIPITDADAFSSNHAVHAGDSVSLLGTFVQKKHQTQWLLY